MNLYRIWALMIRYALIVKWDFGRKLLYVYFPAVDIILFGLIGRWFSQQHETASLLTLYLASRIFWTTSISIYHEMGGNIQIELKALNIINLFSSPMTILEWTIANILNGLIRGLFLLCYSIALTWLIFGTNLLALGTILLPFIPLFIFAWLPMGIFICALYLRYGLGAHFARWTLPPVLMFLSAVFYPPELLPSWIMPISRLLPTTHLFGALRNSLLHHQINGHSIAIATVLIVIYTLMSSLYLRHCFNKSKKEGLTSLEHI